MSSSWTPGEGFRQQVRKFLAQNLPANWKGVGALDEPELSEFSFAWRDTLRESRLLAVDWPVEYGGAGLGEREKVVLEEEFALVGVSRWPTPSDPFGFALLGPTLIHWGTPEQKDYFLPKIVSGEHRWAQGYSEPDAGSDLFGLRTRGVLEGQEWVIDGQKVWQTQGDKANWIFVLTRTEPDQPNGRALSLLLVPVDQPGVEVRTIRTMTGEDEFSEVFLSGARTAADNIVGPRGQGAKVALTLLAFERSAAAGAAHLSYRFELERMTAMARERGRDREPQIRQGIAWCRAKIEMMRILALTAREGLESDAAPGAESSIFKLYESEFHARMTELAMDIMGMDGLLVEGPHSHTVLGPDPVGTPNSTAVWQSAYLRARAAVIYGGSSQIQRNTLGERVLGLPREPRPATGGPKA